MAAVSSVLPSPVAPYFATSKVFVDWARSGRNSAAPARTVRRVGALLISIEFHFLYSAGEADSGTGLAGFDDVGEIVAQHGIVAAELARGDPLAVFKVTLFLAREARDGRTGRRRREADLQLIARDEELVGSGGDGDRIAAGIRNLVGIAEAADQRDVKRVAVELQVGVRV